MSLFDRIAERLKPAPRKRTVRLDATLDGNSATITLGDLTFHLRSDSAAPLTHQDFDFALFGATAVALLNNWDIETDLPITAQAAQAVREAVDILDMWRVRRCHPIAFTFRNLVPGHPPSRDRGLICLSGGVDSTYAAARMARSGLVSHGVLIAGADYPGLQAPGFQDLRSRVARIADHVGLALITADTNIRALNLYWPIAHVFVLAMVLRFHASQFGSGHIAADFLPAQEFGYHPWGNCAPLVQALGQTGFPIRQAGTELGRTAKLAAILREDASLMNHLAVCYKHKDSGENCGICNKCLLTKLNLAAAGVPHAPYFLNNPPLAAQIESFALPDSQAGLRRHMVFLKDIAATLPEGKVRLAVQKRLETLRRRIVPIGKA